MDPKEVDEYLTQMKTTIGLPILDEDIKIIDTEINFKNLSSALNTYKKFMSKSEQELSPALYNNFKNFEKNLCAYLESELLKIQTLFRNKLIHTGNRQHILSILENLEITDEDRTTFGANIGNMRVFALKRKYTLPSVIKKSRVMPGGRRKSRRLRKRKRKTRYLKR